MLKDGDTKGGITNNKGDDTSLYLFSLGSFYFLTVDVLTDKIIPNRLGAETLLPLHIIYLLLQAFGFLTFSLLYRSLQTQKKKRILILFVDLFSIISLIGIVFLSIPWLFITCIMMNLFLSGVIGSSIYYIAAIKLKDSKHTGRFCGFSIGFAAIIQILYSVLVKSNLLGAVLLSIALIIASLIVLFELSFALIPSDNSKVSHDSPFEKNGIIFLLLIVAVISLMGGFNDGVLTIKATENVLNLYSFPRLFYLVGVIISGFIADYKNGRYLSISILIIMLCATVGILFLNNDLLLNLNACVYSLLAGFAIMFFTTPFFQLSIHTKNPSLWAGMGRFIRLIFLVFGTILMEYFVKYMPFLLLIGIFVLLSVLLVLLFWLGGFLSHPHSDSQTSSIPISKEAIAQFACSFQLTTRETEVLEYLLMTEDGVQEIADQIFVSRRVLQRYIAAIYEKTGTKTRIGLFQLYTNVTVIQNT